MAMKGIDILSRIIPKAKVSQYWLWLLNFGLSWTIPFNRPHGFKLFSVSDYRVETIAPYKSYNRNHINGIHACSIATVAEFSSGFLLLMHLDPMKYRLIMSRIEVDYLYQAKEAIISVSSIEQEILDNQVVGPLKQGESATIELQSMVRDFSGNEIATASTTWQVKKWDRVRTTIN